MMFLLLLAGHRFAALSVPDPVGPGPQAPDRAAASSSVLALVLVFDNDVESWVDAGRRLPAQLALAGATGALAVEGIAVDGRGAALMG